MLLQGVLILLPLAVAAQQAAVPTGEFRRAPDGSLTFEVQDYSGTTAVHLHYNINSPLSGVAAGQWNPAIRQKSSGSKWKHENSQVSVKPGDTIHYWILFETTHGGYQRTNLQATITPETTTRRTTTRRTTTARPTTKRATSRPSATGGASTEDSGKASEVPVTVPGSLPDDGATNPPIPPSSGGQTPCSPAPVQCTSYPCVIFEDEFDTLDFDKWQHEITASGGGNWEFQVYGNNRSNSWVEDGKLNIRPTLTSDIYGEAHLTSGLLDIWGNTPASQCTAGQFYGCFRQGTGSNIINPIQSARLRTVKSFSFRYGKVEVEAKMPTGDWMWPAIWMLPKEEHYGTWPASGEIDIVESRGNLNYRDQEGNPFGRDWVTSTLHWGPYFAQNQFPRTHVEKVGSWADKFHKYTMEWDSESIKFSIDDEETMKIQPGAGGFWELGEFEKSDPKMFNPWESDGTPMAPFDREFFLVMNVAVGGTGGFFPDSAINSPHRKPWSDKSNFAPREFWQAKSQWYPTWTAPEDRLQVNYVRVTKLRPDP